ncbi:MAG: hypothetical protein WD232_00100 [Acidimicrobiales bacterium]
MSYDLADVERELCRIPEVRAARIVADTSGHPVEVHVLASPGKHAKQVVRDIQSVAMATVGLSLDHRIVSVVQLDDPTAPGAAPSPPNAGSGNSGPQKDPADDLLEPAGGGAPVSVLDQDRETTAEEEPVRPDPESSPTVPPGADRGGASAEDAPRVVVERVLTLRRDLTCTAEVVLRAGDQVVTGDAEGSAAASATLRLVADATLAALRQLHAGASSAYVETVTLARVSDRAVALSSVVLIVPPNEELVTGSAPVRGAGEHEAVARSVLDAMNRRLQQQRPPSP